jgi:thioredoxin 1
MRATAIALREVIKLWILFLCVHSSTLSGPKGVALALKAKSSNGVYGSKNLSSPLPIFSRLHSIRGGDIVHLRSIEETDEVVAENSNRDDQLVVIYFSSTDCPPCKKVSPLFEELSETFEDLGDKIVFCKVNVDENPIAATQYQVTGWPTFLFLKKGEKVLEIVGGKLAEATLYDWVKLMAPKQEEKEDL